MTHMMHWYDFETSSANASTQALQFASVTTDANLNVIEHSETNLLSVPRRDIIPAPIAFMIHMLDIDHLKEQGLAERDLIAAIQRKFLYAENSQICGYNTMKFDDTVLRHSLYRNSMPAYDHEFRGNNSRFDAFKLVQFVYAMRPELLVFPKKDDGTENDSLKLEALSKANGIVHERAHDAVSDVYATIDLVRIIKERNPKIYDYVQTLTRKQNNESLARAGVPLFHVNFGYGQPNRNSSVILPLVKDSSDRNKYLHVDLREDPYNMLNMTSQEMREYLFTKRAELPVDAPRVPAGSFKINDMPLLVRATKSLMTEDLCQRNNIDPDLINKHMEMIQSSRDLKSRLVAAFTRSHDAPKHIFDTLYSGFFTDADQGFRAEMAAKDQEGLDAEDSVDLAKGRNDAFRALELLVSMKSEKSMTLIEKAVLYRQLNFSFNDADSHMSFEKFEAEVKKIRIEKELTPEQEIVLQKLIRHVDGLKENFLSLQAEVEENRKQIDMDIEKKEIPWLAPYLSGLNPSGEMAKLPFKTPLVMSSGPSV
jgi:exodeoxyribonuclease-1